MMFAPPLCATSTIHPIAQVLYFCILKLPKIKQVYIHICICGYLDVFWNAFVWEIDGKIDAFESMSLQKLGYHVVEYDGNNDNLPPQAKLSLSC